MDPSANRIHPQQKPHPHDQRSPKSGHQNQLSLPNYLVPERIEPDQSELPDLDMAQKVIRYSQPLHSRYRLLT